MHAHAHARGVEDREYHAVIVSGMRQQWLLFYWASAAAVGPERSARTSPQGAPDAPDGEQAAPPAPGREARRAARVGTGAVVLATGAAGSGRDGRRQVARRNVVEGHPPLRLRWQQVQPPVAGGRRPGVLAAAEGVLRGPGGGHGVRGRQEPVHHGAAAGAGARLRRPRPGPRGRGVAEARGGAAVGGDAAGSVVAGERVVRGARRGRGLVDDRREGRRRRLAAGADALGVTGSALPPEWHGHGHCAGSGAARGLGRRGGSRLVAGWQPRPRGRCLGTTVAPDGEERRGEIDAPVGVGHAHDWQPLSLRRECTH